MARDILSLALKINADATGVKLTPLERALASLGTQVEKITEVFEPFTEQSAAAARAQEQFGERFAALAQQLEEKTITAQQYAESFAAIREEAQQASDVFAAAAETTKAFGDSQDTAVESLSEYAEQLRAGALDAETFQKAVADAFEIELDGTAGVAESLSEITDSVASGTGSLDDYAEALRRTAEAQDAEAEATRRQAELQKEADAIIESQLTNLDRFYEKQRELQELLDAGVLPLENYSAALARAAEGLSAAELAEASRATGEAFFVAGEGATEAAEGTSELAAAARLLPGVFGQAAVNVADFFNNVRGASGTITRLGRSLADLPALGASVGRVFSTLGTILLNPVGQLAALLVTSGAVAAGLSRLEAETQKLQNTANKLGVSFRFIETLQEAAKTTGVSFQQVNSATTRLLRTLANADERGQKAAKALGNIGISLESIKGENTEKTIRTIATQLLAIEDPAKRATAAVAIFGKSGAELLPFLENLGEAEQRLDRFNARLSEVDVKRVLDLGNSFNDVGAAIRGVGNEVLTPFIGIAKSVADGLAPVISELGKTFGIVLDALSPLLSGFGVFANVLGQVIGVALRLVNIALKPIADFLKGVGRVIDFLSRDITNWFRQITGYGGAATTSIRATAAAADELSQTMKDALEKGNQALGDAIAKAGQFGQSGFVAASDFQRAVARLNRELEDIGAEEYAKRLAEAKRQFEEQLELVKGVRGELLAIEEENKARIQTDTQIANQILKENDALKEQLQLQKLMGGDASRAKALQNVSAINREIARLEENAAKARKDNDTDAAAAIDAKVVRLREARDMEQQMADGQKTGLQVEKERLAAVEERAKLVDTLLKKSQEETELEKQVNALSEERLRLQDEIGFKRARIESEIEDLASDSSISAEEFMRRSATLRNDAQLAASEQRLKDVEKLREQLDEQQQAAEMGYGEGFDKAFESMNQGFQSLIASASQFGNEGAVAAATFTQFVAKAQQDARERGIQIDQQAIANAEQVFKLELQRLEERKQRELQGQKDIFDAKVAAANRVDAFLKEQIEGRKKAEIDAEDAVAARKREAALNIKAIQDRIDVERAALNAAREAGELDAQAGRAAVQRIRALQQAMRGEKDIINEKFRGQQKLQDQVLADQRAAAEQQRQLAEQYEREQQQRQEQRENVLNQIAAERQAEFERDVQRLQELNTLGSRTIQGIDVRTQQGADLVLGLELGRQDPALIEQRLQTKLLQQIANAALEQVVRNVNAPVSIVGYARLTGN